MKSVGVVYVVDPSENNYIAKEALVSAKSLRFHGGKYKNTPIYFVMPSEKPYDGNYTKTLLEFLKISNTIQVREAVVSLEKCLQTDGYFNKAAGVKLISERIEVDSFLYLDCDTIFLREPPFDLLDDNYVYTATNDKVSYGKYVDTVLKISDELFRELVDKDKDYAHTFGCYIYASTNSQYWEDYYLKYSEYIELIKKPKIRKKIFESSSMKSYLKDLRVEEGQQFNFICGLLDEVIFSELAMKYKCKKIPGVVQEFNILNDTWIFHFDDIPSAVSELEKIGEEGKLLCLL